MESSLNSFKVTDVFAEVHLVFWHDVVTAQFYRLVVLVLVVGFVEIMQYDLANINQLGHDFLVFFLILLDKSVKLA